MPARVPPLRTYLDIDPARADHNALRTQQMGQQNALTGKQLQNYPADRQMALDDRQYEVDKRPARDAQAALQMLQQTAPMLSLGNYAKSREWLINQNKVPEQFLPSIEDIQAKAAENGITPEESLEKLKVAWGEQGKKAAGGGLKVGDTRTRHEKTDGRWMKHTEEFDGAAWSRVDTVPLYKTSASERLDEKRIGAIGKLEDLPPMEAYSQGWRMEDDGRLYIDAATGAPEKLKPFTNTLGKRANMKIIKQVGEHVDDSLEVYTGLQDPVVQSDLKKAESDGMWDKVEGRWSNAVKAWMMRNGISGGSKTFKTIMHMQRMASEQRKTMLGTAVTQTELQSILAWMPHAGDSYETMLGKIPLAAEEGYEEFKRWMDINKDTSNMAPFYKAWGLDRFNMPDKGIKSLARSGMAGDARLPAQTSLQKRGEELEAQGMPEAEIIKTLQQEFPRRADNKR